MSVVVEELVVGEELDRLIGERVMGGVYEHDFIDNGFGECSRCEAVNDMGCIRRGGVACAVPPAYSTDISAAWLVIERMREFLASDNEAERDVWANFVDEMNTRYDYAISKLLAYAGPEGICRAALKALEAT